MALVRGRWYFADDVSVEGVYVPFFRRARFDQLDEPSSPFNIVPPFTTDVVCIRAPCPPIPLPVEQLEPSTSWESAQGGARFNATTGRLDWSVAAYRGFEPFALYEGRVTAAPTGIPDLSMQSRHPRFTMIGGDFESVIAGEWGLRGEVAAFVADSFQGDGPSVVAGRSFDAGLGIDRRAGSYQFSATVLYHHEDPDEPAVEGRSDLSVIVSADRTFARERYQLRGFSVLNPAEETAFVRAIGTARLRDDFALEGSAGWLAGEGPDAIARFGNSDFLYLRLKYYW